MIFEMKAPLFLKKLFSFKGHMSSAEYWQLFFFRHSLTLLIYPIALMIRCTFNEKLRNILIETNDYETTLSAIIGFIIASSGLSNQYITIAYLTIFHWIRYTSSVKRLRTRNRSPWFTLLLLLPIVDWVVFFMCVRKKSAVESTKMIK